MSSMKILTVSLLPLLAAACAAPHQSAPTVAAQKTPTTAAARVAGDLVPGQLVALHVPKPTELALLQGSDALAPLKSFGMATPAEPTIGRDLHRIMRGADPAAFVLPVDAPLGARVIVRPIDPNASLSTVHLIDVATGARLDLARDDSTMAINAAHGLAPQAGPAGAPRDARGAPAPQADGAIAREPGFEPLVNHTRVLSFDVPSKPGFVRIQVAPAIAAGGIIVELQQPNSHITLSGAPDELAHGAGDTVTVTCGLQSDAQGLQGLDGATLSGWAELPGHVRGPELSFAPAGGGQYVAKLSLAGADPATLGAWGLHLHATGTTDGAPYERDVETGFGFFPSHAQMTAFGPPVVARGADGLVDSVSFDVDVQTLVDDRFSVRGTLTYTGADGAEHPLASAQTGQVVTAGNGTITLRFEAASMALANVNGPFMLRDVALVSQGVGTTQHRLGRGLDVATPLLAANEIRYPKVISIQAQDLFDNGDLKARQ